MFKTQILSTDEEGYNQVVQFLKNNEVVGMPSETVYGLAGCGFEEPALLKIFSAKERPHFDPLILHIGTPENRKASLQDLTDWGVVDVSKIPEKTKVILEKMISTFWPGPLTLVLPKTDRISDLATSGFDSVAVRMPAHPVFQEVLKRFKKPLAAPSANRFGRISPTNANDVYSELNERIPAILDGGRCKIGIESTILGLDENWEFVLYRPGGLELDEIKKILGKIPKQQLQADKPIAPGMLKSHYAPGKPFFLNDGSLENWERSVLNEIKERQSKGENVGLLLGTTSAEESANLLKKFEIDSKLCTMLFLSQTGDDKEAAHNLFRYLRDLDESETTCIFAEPWPKSNGLGFAIQDRMKRAASR